MKNLFLFLNCLFVLNSSIAQLIYPKFDFITTSNNIGHQYGFYTDPFGTTYSAVDYPPNIKSIIDDFEIDLNNSDLVRLQFLIDSLDHQLARYENIKFVSNNGNQIIGITPEIIALYDLLRDIPIYQTDFKNVEGFYNKCYKMLTGKKSMNSSQATIAYFGFDAQKNVFIPISLDLSSNNSIVLPQFILYPDKFLTEDIAYDQLNCFNCSPYSDEFISDYKKIRNKLINKGKSNLLTISDLKVLPHSQKLDLLYQVTGIDDNFISTLHNKEDATSKFVDLNKRYVYRFNNDYYFIGQLNEKSKPQGFGQLVTTDHRLVLRAIWEDGLPTQILDVYFYDNIQKVDLTNFSGSYKLKISFNNKGKPYLFLGGFDGTNFNGKCEFFVGSDQKYSGDFVRGYRTGQGLYCWEVGYYRGEWLNDNQHGKGEWLYTDSTYCSGEFYNGSRQGYGILKYKNGNKYEGEFKSNTFDGKGKFTLSNGTVEYEGNYKEGYYEGQGKRTYTTGDYYAGNFKKGKFEGWGEYFYANRNETYRGNWVAGGRQGYGELNNSAGVIIERGDYVNGVYQPPIEIRQTEIANNSTTTGNCSFQFSKPKLNITWIDNRKSCCNPYCTRYASYSNIQKENQIGAEKIYLSNVLEAHFLEVGADEKHKEQDRLRLNDFLNKTYANSSAVESMFGAFTNLAMSQADIFSSSINSTFQQYNNKSKEDRIKELRSKNREALMYSNGRHCSEKCEKFCKSMGY